MQRIALIGCSKSKKGKNTPNKYFLARDIYTGKNFLKSVSEGVKYFGCDDFYILSAKYGLLEKDEKIAWYDKSLYEMSTAHRKQWARKVLDNLLSKYDLENTEFVIFAGSLYSKYLAGHLNCITLQFRGRYITFNVKKSYDNGGK